MTKYAVSGFRFEKEFDSEKEARNFFNEVKQNFTYCELKKVDKNSARHRSESIEIFYK